MQMIAAVFMGRGVAWRGTPGKAHGAGRARVAPGGEMRHTSAMPQTRAFVNAHCAALPGAQVSDPWGGGHDAWKVGGKLFAVVGAMNNGVSVKCPDVDTARLLIDLGRAVRAPYFHASWVHLPWDQVPDHEMRDRLTESYRIIRTGLPRKLQATLGDLEP